MECPQLEAAESGGFMERLRMKLTDQRIPISGTLELTFRCNLRCVHCYVGDYRNGHPTLPESTTAEIKNYLDQIANSGCMWLLLTGGEVLVRPDFLEIYIHAKRKGLLITLFTNGTLVTPRIAETLAEYPPLAVEITLYGSSQETYERVTGIPGSYKACLRGIETLLDKGVPVKLKTMLMTINCHEYQSMQDLARNLGVNFRFDPLLNACIDGRKSPLSYRLSPEEAVKFDLGDPMRFREWKEKSVIFADYKVDSRFLFTCGAGLNTFHVDPYGQLFPCMMSRTQGYNLHGGAFYEGWNSFLSQVREQLSNGKSECKNCKLTIFCGQCPGWATLESGNPEMPVDYLCQVAHLRAKKIRNNL